MGKEGKSLVTNVSCTVSNCYFWAQDNICSADNILITADKVAGAHSTMALGQESWDNLVEKIGETPSPSMAETACYTFKPR